MSEMILHPEPDLWLKAHAELGNPGDLAEALATQALEAINHLFQVDGNTIRNGEKWYGLLVNNERRTILIDYNKKLGANLRTVRLVQRLSLSGVAKKTGNEFKASVVGAYERGERAISAVRLHGLCEVYEIKPIDVLPDE